MSNHRWSKFVWSDWDNDRALRKVSLEAQGLWMRLLCIAHDATPRGYVLIDGRKPTVPELTRLVQAPDLDGVMKPHWRSLERLLKVLCDARVCDLDANGVMFSRRMVRDENTHQVAVARGKKGGNPKLKETKELKPKLKPKLKPELNADSDSDSESERKKEKKVRTPPLTPPHKSGEGNEENVSHSKASKREAEPVAQRAPFRPRLVG